MFDMKNILKSIRIGGCVFFFFLVIKVPSQIKPIDYKVDCGAYLFVKNDAQNPCITHEDYIKIDAEVAYNCKKLGLNKINQRNVLTTSLLWPIKAATNFTDCGFHFIGAYVDQNTTAGSIQDYNCGTNTYDGHTGTDIAIWPFGFYKMDNSQVEVIAAAAGTIIQRADGNFDRNCTSNTMIANSIIIQHADGSYALYWHMKSGSVTSKLVGQTVVAGEYLGVVGSSGSSSGPHLHFEVRTGNTSASYKDPFSGTCNILNPTSWWASQRPHTDPAILKASVNTTDIPPPNCPNTEISNESNTFAIPFQGAGLPAGYAKFYAFIREGTVGTIIDMKILNPNGSIFNNWTYSISNIYKVAYYGFSKLLPTTAGAYTFQATYNGISCSKVFTITTPLSINDFTDSKNLQIYPNPTENTFTVFGENLDLGNYSFQIINEYGQIVKKETTSLLTDKLDKNISIGELSSGLYLLKIENETTQFVKKIIKK